jgi:hypothetical protein
LLLSGQFSFRGSAAKLYEFEASGAYRPKHVTEAADARLSVVELKEHCPPREDSVVGLRSRPDAVV